MCYLYAQVSKPSGALMGLLGPGKWFGDLVHLKAMASVRTVATSKIVLISKEMLAAAQSEQRSGSFTCEVGCTQTSENDDAFGWNQITKLDFVAQELGHGAFGKVCRCINCIRRNSWLGLQVFPCMLPAEEMFPPSAPAAIKCIGKRRVVAKKAHKQVHSARGRIKDVRTLSRCAAGDQRSSAAAEAATSIHSKSDGYGARRSLCLLGNGVVAWRYVRNQTWCSSVIHDANR